MRELGSAVVQIGEAAPVLCVLHAYAFNREHAKAKALAGSPASTGPEPAVPEPEGLG